MSLEDNLKILSEETDDYFLARSRGITIKLPKELQKEARALLDGIERGMEKLPKSVVFIPVGHWLGFDRIRENALEKEVYSILKGEVQKGDIVSCGETITTGAKFEAEEITKEKLKILKRLFSMGVSQKRSREFISESSKKMCGFEKAIMRFNKRSPGIRCIGTE